MNLNCHFVSQLKPYHFVLMRKRWIPESPRWLVAHNRLDEAHGLLMKYATKNGVSVDPKQLRHMISEVRKADVRKNDTRKYGTCDLVRTPKLRKENYHLLFQLVRKDDRKIICFVNYFMCVSVVWCVYTIHSIHINSLGLLTLWCTLD